MERPNLDAWLEQSEQVADEADAAIEGLKAYLNEQSLVDYCFTDLHGLDPEVVKETVYERLHGVVDEDTATIHLLRWFS